MRQLAVETTPKPKVKPLQKGEVRSALRDTRNVVGIMGLRWYSIAKRAVLGRKP